MFDYWTTDVSTLVMKDLYAAWIRLLIGYDSLKLATVRWDLFRAMPLGWFLKHQCRQTVVI